jgi:hypothetical protein
MKLKVKYLLVITLLFNSVFSFGQKISFSIGNANKDKESNLIIPVNTNNFRNICAVGIKISYDTTKIKFIECNSINTNMKTAIFNAFHGVLGFVWVSSDGRTPINMNDGLLFNMKFKILSKGSSPLLFMKDECMVSDCDLNNKVMILNNNKTPK